MESTTADDTTADEALEPITASAVPARSLPGYGGASDDECPNEVLFPSNPLRRQKDHCLERLAGIARLEARTAAAKVQVIAELVEVSTALDPPAQSPQEATAQEMALVAEVACALTVGERTASTLLAESHILITE
jgi:hypothetical protein